MIYLKIYELKTKMAESDLRSANSRDITSLKPGQTRGA